MILMLIRRLDVLMRSPLSPSPKVTRSMFRRGLLRLKKETMKERVQKQLELEQAVKSRVANFPHRSLLKVAAPVSESSVTSASFMQQIRTLKKMASDAQCLSFSAPKNHWDARVVLVKNAIEQEAYETWVNPVIPQYDSTQAITPMYGMWENCVSCGVCHAWILRPQTVMVKGWDEFGNEKQDLMSGIRARTLMHELDHLDAKVIIHRALGPEFIVSMQALSQKDLWPANFPSAEANMTGPCQFFDYVKNEPIIPPGMEWYFAQAAHNQFDDKKINS